MIDFLISVMYKNGTKSGSGIRFRDKKYVIKFSFDRIILKRKK